jgi:hypothetical protein
LHEIAQVPLFVRLIAALKRTAKPEEQLEYGNDQSSRHRRDDQTQADEQVHLASKPILFQPK